MKLVSRAPTAWLRLAVTAFLLVPSQSLRAQQTQELAGREALITAALELMEAARYCALITLDRSGQPRARTMDPFLPEEGMVVWLGTHRKSRKVRDIENDPRVTLYYFSPDADGYVSIHGTARLVDDPVEKARRWKEGWEQFFADREADYLLIAVDPERMEVISYSRGLVGDPLTWEPPAVDIRDGGALQRKG